MDKENYFHKNRDSGSKNGGSSLQKYQSFSYSIGDVSDANGYKLPPKYRKMRINFVKIEILEVKTGVQVFKNINHFHIALAMSPMQMDINYPLNIGKIYDGKLPRVKFYPG